jgi:hypothetical protein
LIVESEWVDDLRIVGSRGDTECQVYEHYTHAYIYTYIYHPYILPLSLSLSSLALALALSPYIRSGPKWAANNVTPGRGVTAYRKPRGRPWAFGTPRVSRSPAEGLFVVYGLKFVNFFYSKSDLRSVGLDDSFALSLMNFSTHPFTPFHTDFVWNSQRQHLFEQRAGDQQDPWRTMQGRNPPFNPLLHVLLFSVKEC